MDAAASMPSTTVCAAEGSPCRWSATNWLWTACASSRAAGGRVLRCSPCGRQALNRVGLDGIPCPIVAGSPGAVAGNGLATAPGALAAQGFSGAFQSAGLHMPAPSQGTLPCPLPGRCQPHRSSSVSIGPHRSVPSERRDASDKTLSVTFREKGLHVAYLPRRPRYGGAAAPGGGR